MSFFCSRIPSRAPHCIWFSRLLKFFLICSNFLSFFVLDDLTVLKNIGQICRMSLNLGLFDAFLMITLGLWVLGRKTTEVNFSLPIVSGDTWYHLLWEIWYLFMVIFARFPHYQDINFSFPYCCSLDTSHEVHPILKGDGIKLHFLEVNYSEHLILMLPHLNAFKDPK